MANFNKSLTSTGLGTIATVTVPEASYYNVQGKISTPNITAGSSANSSLVVVVNKNGSPEYTGAAGSRGFSTTIACAAADVITVVLTSAAAVDANLNTIKSTVTISVGP